MSDLVDSNSTALKPGVRVSWIDALGNRHTGVIDEIEDNGNVYVAEARTGTRGNVYLVSQAFTKHESHRLTIRGAMSKAEPSGGTER